MRHSGFPLAARRRRSPSPTRPRTADASIRTPAAAASTPAASPVISAFHVDFFGIHTVAVGESCIRLWSLKGGPCRHAYRTPSRAVSVSKTGGLHRNPYLLFAGGQDGSLFTFSTVNKQLIRQRTEHERRVGAVTPFGTDHLATGSADWMCKVWNLRTGRSEQELRGHKGEVTHVIAQGAHTLLTAATDGTAKLWDIRTATRKGFVQEYYHGRPIGSLAMSHGGKIVTAHVEPPPGARRRNTAGLDSSAASSSSSSSSSSFASRHLQTMLELSGAAPSRGPNGGARRSREVSLVREWDVRSRKCRGESELGWKNVELEFVHVQCDAQVVGGGTAILLGGLRKARRRAAPRHVLQCSNLATMEEVMPSTPVPGTVTVGALLGCKAVIAAGGGGGGGGGGGDSGGDGGDVFGGRGGTGISNGSGTGSRLHTLDIEPLLGDDDEGGANRYGVDDPEEEERPISSSTPYSQMRRGGGGGGIISEEGGRIIVHVGGVGVTLDSNNDIGGNSGSSSAGGDSSNRGGTRGRNSAAAAHPITTTSMPSPGMASNAWKGAEKEVAKRESPGRKEQLPFTLGGKVHVIGGGRTAGHDTGAASSPPSPAAAYTPHHGWDTLRPLVQASTHVRGGPGGSRALQDSIMVRRQRTSFDQQITTLGEEGRLDDALGVLIEMKRNRIWPDIFTFHCAVIACIKNGDLDRGLAVFASVQHTIAEAASSNTCVALLKGAGVGKREDLIRPILQAITVQGILPSSAISSAHIEACIKCGNIITARNSLEFGVRLGISPTSTVFLLLLQGCRDFRLPDIAFEVFDRMRTARVKQSVPAFQMLFEVCTKAGLAAEAFGVLRRQASMHGPPDAAMYQAALSALSKVGSGTIAAEGGEGGPMGLLDEILGHMKSQRVVHTIETCDATVDVCLKHCDERAALRLINVIGVNGIHVDTVNKLLGPLGQQGRVDECEALMALLNGGGEQRNAATTEHVRRKGSVVSSTWRKSTAASSDDRQFNDPSRLPNGATLSCMITAYVQGDNLGRALETFQESFDRQKSESSNAIQLTVAVYNSLLRGFGSTGDIQSVLHVFDVVDRDENVTPNADTYYCVVDACRTVGNYGRALYLFERVVGDAALRPPRRFFESIIDIIGRAAARAGTRAGAGGDEGENDGAFKAAIGRVDVLGAWAQLESRCIRPRERTFATAITSCVRVGDLEGGLCMLGALVAMLERERLVAVISIQKKWRRRRDEAMFGIPDDDFSKRKRREEELKNGERSSRESKQPRKDGRGAHAKETKTDARKPSARMDGVVSIKTGMFQGCAMSPRRPEHLRFPETPDAVLRLIRGCCARIKSTAKVQRKQREREVANARGSIGSCPDGGPGNGGGGDGGGGGVGDDHKHGDGEFVPDSSNGESLWNPSGLLDQLRRSLILMVSVGLDMDDACYVLLAEGYLRIQLDDPSSCQDDHTGQARDLLFQQQRGLGAGSLPTIRLLVDAYLASEPLESALDTAMEFLECCCEAGLHITSSTFYDAILRYMVPASQALLLRDKEAGDAHHHHHQHHQHQQDRRRGRWPSHMEAHVTHIRQRLEQQGTRPRQETLELLAGAYCATYAFEEASQLIFHHVRKTYGAVATPVMYMNLLQTTVAHGNASVLGWSCKALQALMNVNAPPPLALIHALLVRYGRLKRLDAMQDISSLMAVRGLVKTTATYNILINACADILAPFEAMTVRGLDEVTRDGVVGGAVEGAVEGRLTPQGGARGEDRKPRGSIGSGGSPSAATAKRRGAKNGARGPPTVETKALALAEDILKTMRASGVKLTRETYVAQIRMFGNCHNLARAEHAFKAAKAAKLANDALVSLLVAACRACAGPDAYRRAVLLVEGGSGSSYFREGAAVRLPHLRSVVGCATLVEMHAARQQLRAACRLFDGMCQMVSLKEGGGGNGGGSGGRGGDGGDGGGVGGGGRKGRVEGRAEGGVACHSPHYSPEDRVALSQSLGLVLEMRLRHFNAQAMDPNAPGNSGGAAPHDAEHARLSKELLGVFAHATGELGIEPPEPVLTELVYHCCYWRGLSDAVMVVRQGVLAGGALDAKGATAILAKCLAEATEANEVAATESTRVKGASTKAGASRNGLVAAVDTMRCILTRSETALRSHPQSEPALISQVLDECLRQHEYALAMNMLHAAARNSTGGRTTGGPTRGGSSSAGGRRGKGDSMHQQREQVQQRRRPGDVRQQETGALDGGKASLREASRRLNMLQDALLLQGDFKEAEWLSEFLKSRDVRPSVNAAEVRRRWVAFETMSEEERLRHAYLRSQADHGGVVLR